MSARAAATLAAAIAATLAACALPPPPAASAPIASAPPPHAAGTRTITVTMLGKGSARVRSEPAGIACPGQCSAEFPVGTQLDFSVAIPDRGEFFGGWTLGPCPHWYRCQFEVTEDAVLEAYIAKLQSLVVRVHRDGADGAITSAPGDVACGAVAQGGAGIDACEVEQPHGATVTVTASPAPGARLVTWGNVRCPDASVLTCTFTMGESARFDPVFAPA